MWRNELETVQNVQASYDIWHLLISVQWKESYIAVIQCATFRSGHMPYWPVHHHWWSVIWSCIAFKDLGTNLGQKCWTPTLPKSYKFHMVLPYGKCKLDLLKESISTPSARRDQNHWYIVKWCSLEPHNHSTPYSTSTWNCIIQMKLTPGFPREKNNQTFASNIPFSNSCSIS